MSFIVLDSRYIANSRKVEEAIFATCYHFYYPIFLLLATSTSWRSGRLIFSDMARKVIPYFQPTDSSSWTERFSGVSFQLAKQILINSRYLKQYYIQYGVALTSQHYFRRPPDDFLGRLQGSCSTTVGPPWMSWRCTFQAVQGRRRQISLAKTHWWLPFGIQRWQLDILCKWRF